MKTTVLITAALALSSCTTTKDFLASAKNAFKSDEKAAIAPVSEMGDIVQQTGRAAPVVSLHDRATWIEMRDAAKDDRSKMYATLATGEARVAEIEARQVLKKHPNDAAGLQVLAVSLVLQRKYELADFYALQLERHHAGSAVAANVRGIAAAMQPQNRVKDFEVAARFFEQAMNASSGEVAAGLNLGHLQLELGNTQAAADVFETTRVRCKDCKEALMGSGIAMARSGNHRGAEGRFNQILAKHPKNAEAIYRLALVAKYGYNDKKTAIKNLRTILTDTNVSGADRVLKQRASTMLRALESEVDRSSGSSKSQIAAETAPSSTPATDKSDAEAMMTGMEEEEPAQ